MKTFRLIGMALIAIIMCVNFVSCSSENNEEPETEKKGIFVAGKNIKEIRSNGYYHSFNYDEQGRVIKYNEDSETYTYTYDNKEIVKKAKYDDVTFTYTLENNLISECKKIEHRSYGTDTLTTKYFYTNSTISRIEVKERDNYSNVTNPAFYQDYVYYYTWNEGNISTRKYIAKLNADSYTCNMHYTTAPCYFTLGQFCGLPDATNVDIFLLWEGYYGTKPKNIVKFEEKTYNDGYTDVINHEYEFDKDGFVTSGYYQMSHGGSSSKQFLDITWE